MIEIDEALENLKLNEAFSDTMPDWLRRRLQRDSANPVQLSKKVPGLMGLKPHMYGNRFEGENNLLRILLQAGYDPSSMNVFSAPVPSSLDNEYVQDPMNLVIYHVVTPNDDKVYIPGINDDEKYYVDGSKSSTFKYFNNKNLKDYVKDFAYIKLDDESTFVPQNKLKRFEQDPHAYILPGDIAYDRDPETARLSRPKVDTRIKDYWGDEELNRRYRDASKARYDSQYYDKSGYYRGAEAGQIVGRFKEKLKEFKKYKWAKQVEKADSVLLQAQEAIAEYMNSIKFGNMRDPVVRKQFYDGQQYINKLISQQYDFERIVYTLNSVQDAKDITYYQLTTLESVCNRVIESAQQVLAALKEYSPAEFVW